jgi:hypothetical protein
MNGQDMQEVEISSHRVLLSVCKDDEGSSQMYFASYSGVDPEHIRSSRQVRTSPGHVVS